MKRTSLLVALLLLHLSLIPANILFDLHGVIFYQHEPTICYHAGLSTLACYIVRSGNTDIKGLLFDLVDQIPYQARTAVQAKDDEGNVLPALLSDWLAGYVTSAQVRSYIDAFLHDESCAVAQCDKQMIQAIASVLFTPDIFAQATCVYDQTIALVKACKAAGHSVYVLSNWDEESFQFVYQRHKEVLDLFDGMIISGQINLIKPDKAIYHYALETFKLDPATTAFVDDQHINVYAAGQCDLFAVCVPTIKYIFSKEPDIAYVCRALNTWLQAIGQELIVL